MSDQKTWRHLITHDCSRSESFEAARQELESLKKNAAVKIEIGPLNEEKPNIIRIHVMGEHVLVGVLFQDCRAVCTITAPKSLAWAERMVRGQVEKLISDLLKRAGSSFVEISQFK